MIDVFEIDAVDDLAVKVSKLRAINAELVEALKFAVSQHDYSGLDRGIGTATADGCRWIAARNLIAKAEKVQS